MEIDYIIIVLGRYILGAVIGIAIYRDFFCECC